MDYREDQQAETQLLEALRKDILVYDGSREGVPHVTELIYCLTKSWFSRFRQSLPMVDAMEPSDHEALLWGTGIVMERVLLSEHKQHIKGEFDGIQYELDALLSFGPHGEMKTTRIWAKNLQLDQNTERMPMGWIRQLLSYHKVLGLDQMLFIPWHLIDSVLKAWRVKPTPEEIQLNWDWMRERRDILNAAIEKGEPPTPFEHNMEYECKNCRMKMICDSLTATRRQQSG